MDACWKPFSVWGTTYLCTFFLILPISRFETSFIADSLSDCSVQAGLGRWEGFDVSAVFIRVSGSLCSLSIMEEAISPASRPHHKNVSWYKETRWIITRRDSCCSPSLSLCLSLSASLIASVSLIDYLVYFSLFLPRLVVIPLIFLLRRFLLMRLFSPRVSLSLSLSHSALRVSLSRRLILYKAAVWLYVMLSG